MTTAKHINLQAVHESSFGNKSFVIQIIELFLSETPEALKRINEQARQGNTIEVKKELHKLKPNLELLGMTKLLPTVARMEAYTGEPDEKFQQDIYELREYIALSFEELKLELNMLKPGT